jgi:hypothetical protein
VQFISSIPPGQSGIRLQTELSGKQPKYLGSPSGHIEGIEPLSHLKVALTVHVKESKLIIADLKYFHTFT